MAIFAGNISGSSLTGSLNYASLIGVPTGIVSSSTQVDITQTTGYNTFSSSLATVDAGQTTRIDNLSSATSSYALQSQLAGVASSSAQVKTYLPDGTVSSSGQVDIAATTGYSTFSSSLATVDAGQTTRIDNLSSATSSYAINATIQSQLAGVVSSSTQVKPLLPDGTVTSSAQYPGWVTASSQIDYNNITNKLSGVVSSSAQVQPLLPAGTVSSSAQYPGWVTASSQIVVQNTTGIAAIATTGSNIFVGNQTVTGSLFTSGSNTLIGNTRLTGSFGISGSEIVQGYMQFEPVTTNIDTSLSASYIYVSGSTNDLYFSQNGAGYNNVTRLRWLESNMYTGILHGGVLSSTTGSTTFNISSGSGIIVTMNATQNNSPYPTIKYVEWGNKTNIPITYSGSAKITYVGLDNNGDVVQQTVPWGTTDINQWDTQIALGVVLHLAGNVSTGVFNSPQISYGYPQKTDDFTRAFGPLKISGHTLQASGSSPTLSIKKTGGTSFREGANYANNPNHPSTVTENDVTVSKIYRYYISGSTPVIDTGVGGAGYTAIDNTQYVNTATGTLTTVNANNYSIQRVFWIPNSPTNAFIVYYGNAEYTSLLNAVNAKDSEVFTEAPNTAQNAIFLGFIIVQGGTTPARDLLNPTYATIIPGGLFRTVGGVASSGTSPVATALASLSDVGISGLATGDLLVYNGATWNNTKSLNGTYSLTGSLATNDGITAVTINATSISSSLSGSGAGVFGVNYNTLSNIPSDIVSSSTQVKTLLPGGTVSSSAQYPGWVTASSQIDYNSITNKLSGVVSSSTQVQPLLPGGTVSSSGQVTITSTTGYSTFSSSIATKNDVQDVSINALNAATSSYAINSTIQSQLAGVVSSSTQVKPLLPGGTVTSSAQYPGWVTASSQIDYNNIQNKLSGVISSSTQFNALSGTSASFATTAITASYISGNIQFNNGLDITGSLLVVGTVSASSFTGSILSTNGVVSSSAQIDYNSIQNKLSGVVSSSTQVQPLLPGGTVSSSAQYPGWVTSSAQIDYNSIQNKLSGVISSSTQFNALSGTSASFAATASFVNTLLQTVSASGNIAAGTNLVSNNSIGDEGGEILLAKPQTNSTITGSGVTIDVYQNRLRFYEQGGSARGFFIDITSGSTSVGTNLQAASAAVSTYTNASDNRVITSTGAGGINAESTLTYDGTVLAISTNGAKYFQGGDDAALYDVNIVNTLGIHGQQDSTVGAIKLGSNGQVIYSNATGVGIGTTAPGALLHVQGNVSASAFTGSLLGTGSWANNSVTASYVTFANVDNKPTLVSSSAQIDYNSIQNKLSGVVSSSAQVQPLLPGGTVSSSAQVLLNTVAGTTFSNNSFYFPLNLRVDGTLTAQQINTEFVSSSIIYESGSSKFGDTTDDVMSVTGSIRVLGGSISGSMVGMFSSSAQVDYNSIQNKLSGVVSSSAQVQPLLPAGTVSSSAQYPGWVTASSQIDYNSITNKLSGVVSSSTQVQPLLPGGTVSSSAQYPGWVTSSAQIVVQNTTGIGALATTGSNTFIGNQIITGSLVLSGSALPELRVVGESVITGSLSVQGTISGNLVLPTDTVSSSTQVKAFLPGGTVTSSAQYPGWVTASSQIDYNSITNKLSGVYSSSAQTVAALSLQTIAPATVNATNILSGSVLQTGTDALIGRKLAVTGSAEFTGTVTASNLTANQAVFTNASDGLVSNAITGTGNVVMSASPTLTGTLTAANITATGTMLLAGIFSSSAQVDYNSIQNKLSGVVSSSGQVQPLLPGGTVSSSAQYPGWVTASSQIDYNSITNKLSGVYSSSTQAVAAIAGQTIAPATVNATNILSGSVLQTGTNALIGGKLAVTGSTELTGTVTASNLTANQAVFTNASDGLVSNAITGTGNVVMSASPTLTGTVTAANITANGTLLLQNIVSQSSAPTFTGLTSTGTVLLAGIYSSSGQVDITATTNYTTFSSSIATKNNLQDVSINALNAATSSYAINSTIQSQLAGVISSSAQTVAAIASQTIAPTTVNATTINASVVTASALTANQAVFTNASDGLVSNAITGTGNVVMSASPTLTGTITAQSITATGTVLLAGIVSQSSQIDYNSITNKLSGVYSSSVQTVASLSGQAVTFSGSQFSGIVSGSGLQYRLVVPVGTNYYAT